MDEEIEKIKKEIELDTELDAEDIKYLNEVISELQRLNDFVIKKCNKKNIDPKKCYINWWISF